MNQRPLKPATRRVVAVSAAVAVVAAATLVGCGLAARSPAANPPAESVRLEQESDARPMDGSGEVTTGSTVDAPARPDVGKRGGKSKTFEFSDDTVSGDLSRPDGEYVESRKKTKHQSLIRVPSRLGPAAAEDPSAHAGNKQPPEKPADPKPVTTPVPGPQKKGDEKEGGEAAKKDFLRHYGVNPTVETSDERFSTFAADVDTGSYTMARAYLERGQLPPEAAVRVEEFVNAFDYGYRPPETEAFAVQVEAFPSPNRKGYHVLHLGLKGREVSAAARKPASLVFTLDVSGSMDQANRLPLAKRALGLLLDQLDERDQVALVVYGDAARIVLPPTNAAHKERIAAAIDSLRSEGSTNVQAGLELAYTVALKAFRPDGTNRVILLSDGVANNGITHADGIFAKVKAKAGEGITLTTVGFGMDDYNDVLMERLADQGDGQYAYVDKLDEARRIFVEQLTGTLQVIAKDVKLQLEFNPEAIARYRLLGFENRALSKQDFHDDKKDAGEMGAGHQVTAVYEVKFKSRAPATFATFRARFKQPRSATSGLVEKPLPMSLVKDSLSASSGPARLSLVATGFAEKLRGSYWARNLEWGELLELFDGLPEGLKRRPQVEELRTLLLTAKRLDRRPDRFERDQPLATMDFDRIPVLR